MRNRAGEMVDWFIALPFEPFFMLLDRMRNPLSRLLVVILWLVLLLPLMVIGIVGGGLFAIPAIVWGR